MARLAGLAFRYMPQSILWNARVLPFWFLTLYLLGGLAVAELFAIMAERTTGFMVTLRAALLPGPLSSWCWHSSGSGSLCGYCRANERGQRELHFLGGTAKDVSYIPGWVSWNYSGYQYLLARNCAPGRGWPEYKQIVAQLEKASKRYGCGSVMWEYHSAMNDYGTPDALTILPYWTNGCIGSMEGLYYEASATTPFHFINQSELSLQPSDPMVGIPYASSPNVALGVEHLQMLGVKYYMALNTELQAGRGRPVAQADLHLWPVQHHYRATWATARPAQKQYWKLYLVLGSPRVHPWPTSPSS